MNKLLLFILFTFSANFFAQDFQISNTGIYSVDVPHVDVGNTSANMIYGTNLRCYNFDIDGIATPINDPVIPAENFGPNSTDIAVDPTNDNHIAIAYYDYHYDYNTSVDFYGCYIVESTDGGQNWDSPTLLDTIEIGNSISNLVYNMPRVEFGETGNMFILWNVHSNGVDTNAIYVGDRNSIRNRIDNENTNDLEVAIDITVETRASKDWIAVSYGKMENSHAKFYLRYSKNGISGMEDEVFIKDDGQTFLTTEHFTKSFINADGVMKYVYADFAHGPKLTISNDWGTTWNDAGTVEVHKYIYVAIDRIPAVDNSSQNYYVKLYYDDNSNLVYYASNDLLNWQYGGKMNGDGSDVAGWAGTFIDFKFTRDNNYIVSTWIDNRTANEEIFYSKAPLPNIVSIDNEIQTPTEYSLMQNYPNPFNPTTQITYQLPSVGFVNLTIYNLIGQKTAVLVNQQQTAGEYTVEFNANNQPSGIYFYELKTGKFNSVKKMILLK